MNTEQVSRQTAEKNGYNVDTHCYPWLAYRGPRFAPTAVMPIPTDIEYHAARLMRAIGLRPRKIIVPKGLPGFKRLQKLIFTK